MSFDYNPYKHIEIVDNGEGLGWYCHSCGADQGRGSSSLQRLSLEDTRIVNVWNDYERHIRVSHKCTREDFEDWSVW